jgi:hypothetical protein
MSMSKSWCLISSLSNSTDVTELIRHIYHNSVWVGTGHSFFFISL